MTDDRRGLYQQALGDFLTKLQSDISAAEGRKSVDPADRRSLARAKLDLASWSDVLTEWTDIIGKERGDDASELVAQALVDVLEATLSVGGILRRSAATRKVIGSQAAAVARFGKAQKALRGEQGARGQLLDETIKELVLRWRSEGKRCSADAVRQEVNHVLKAKGFPGTSGEDGKPPDEENSVISYRVTDTLTVPQKIRMTADRQLAQVILIR